MQADDRLASTCRATNSGRTAEVARDDCALIRMEEDHPVFDGTGKDVEQELGLGASEQGTGAGVLQLALDLAVFVGCFRRLRCRLASLIGGGDLTGGITVGKQIEGSLEV